MDLQEEEKQRCEIRRQAQASLAEFNEKRQREIEERRERRAAESESYLSSGAVIGGAKQTAEELRGTPLPPLLAAAAACVDNKTKVSTMAGLDGFPPGMLQQLAGLQAADGFAGASSSALLAGLFGALQASASSIAAPSTLQATLTLRVREAGFGFFRRVQLPIAQPGRANSTFKEVELRVCEKFRTAKGADGMEVGFRPLVSLVRISDQLEIGDDEDICLLANDDEMEATFAEVR